MRVKAKRKGLSFELNPFMCGWSLFFKQVVKETVQIGIQILHQVSTDDDSVIVREIQFSDRFLVVVFKNQTEWFQASISPLSGETRI